jgi:hypothetical protein
VNLPIEVSAHAVDRLLGPRFKAGVENREMVDGWKKTLCGFEVLSFTHKKGFYESRRTSAVSASSTKPKRSGGAKPPAFFLHPENLKACTTVVSCSDAPIFFRGMAVGGWG